MWKACEEHLNSSQLGHPCCEASLPATAPPTFFFLIKVKNSLKKKHCRIHGNPAYILNSTGCTKILSNYSDGSQF